MAVMVLLLSACEKDLMDVELNPKYDTAPPAYYIDINDVGAGLKTIDQQVAQVAHQLGPDRGNPFTVKQLNTAELAVYGSLSNGGHVATDHYVKFSPQDYEDLTELEEADFFLTDFPWTQELFEEGDYYQTTGSPDDFPELYTTVSVGAVLPNVPHTILDPLDLSEDDPVIIKKAFENTGNGQSFVDDFEQSGMPQKLDFSNQKSELDFETDGDDTDDTDGGGGGGGGGGVGPLINDCGCVISRNTRRPGGTIKVEDTQFQRFVPVRRVRVIGKNGWFTWHRANTDDNGCWRIDHTYRGRTWFWVDFEDKERCNIRFAGVRGWRVWQKSQTGSVFLGRIAGNNVNNIVARFGAWDGGTVGTKTHYAWAGATVNNAIHEFHDFADQEGFISPPKINTMVALGRRDGFAPMMRQMGVVNLMNAVSDGFAASLSQASLPQTGLGILFNVVTGVVISGSPAGNLAIRTFLGDVNIGGSFTDSDALKRLAYHEIGHASHFEGSSIGYWKDLIRATVAAGGHGDEDSFMAGHLQIAESWAEHMALTMVKQQYPLNLINDDTGNSVFDNDWAVTHEVLRNESFGHIPTGLYNDLIDGQNTNEQVREANSSVFFLLDDTPLHKRSNRSPRLRSVIGLILVAVRPPAGRKDLETHRAPSEAEGHLCSGVT
jgi:hypothetical protein